MTSVVDSEAHFLKRCKETHLSASSTRALTDLGLTTLGAIAFAVGQPGTPIAESEFQAFVQQTLEITLP